jgi:hypothetical protein
MLLVNNCGEEGFVADSGSVNLTLCPEGNDPEDNSTINTCPANVAVADAPELGAVNTTTFDDKD